MSVKLNRYRRDYEWLLMSLRDVSKQCCEGYCSSDPSCLCDNRNGNETWRWWNKVIVGFSWMEVVVYRKLTVEIYYFTAKIITRMMKLVCVWKKTGNGVVLWGKKATRRWRWNWMCVLVVGNVLFFEKHWKFSFLSYSMPFSFG